jgi:uroporphyrinogen decarboxylase
MNGNGMTPREIVRRIIGRKEAPRCGFWLGNPHPDSWPELHRYFGTSKEEDLRRKLGDDFRWIRPQSGDSTYRHPEGKKIFDLWRDKDSLSQAGPLAACRTVGEIDKFDWPELRYLNFAEITQALEGAGDYYRASGFWTPFFHDIMDLFGMEAYMVNMVDNPGLVHAVTDRVCEFYFEANERLYTAAGGHIDGFFFGNDFGTQLDLIMSPAHFDEFILPWFRRFTDQAHRHGFQVILHSCGSIYRVIDRLIGAGVECLHPLQARARNMDAETLAREFKRRWERRYVGLRTGSART